MATVRRVSYAVAGVLNAVGMAIVVVLLLHVALTLLDANPDNTAARLIRQLAEYFNLGLSNLFLLDDPRWQIGVNYGVAALIWLVITAVVVRLVRRIG